MQRTALQNPSTKPRAFSLIELLAVITIISILTLSVVPSFNGVLSSSNLGQGAQSLADEIELCRTTAIGKNKPVELCLIREEGETSGPFKLYRSRTLEPDGTHEWLTRLRRLPEGLSISASEELSNIVAAQAAQSNDDGDSEVTIRFDPSGEMKLPGSSQNLKDKSRFVTVALDSDLLVSPDTLPANFALIQIDPRNSQVTVHRP